ncbi:hypothetical protein QAD02_018582 [Eretmocerus hayati]|uniref:Uncharacterized protein n=1 Tax=Eretmocerus hayati TaxID=131215 RepID=A0ACC2PH90_9HYME|nr:hypothetical protein QAD02_018582 [Eretmocerus hayati]
MNEAIPRTRSPLKVLVENNIPIESYILVKFSRDVMERLGCLVNEQIFVECPYAFVDRNELLSELPLPNREDEIVENQGELAEKSSELMKNDRSELPPLVLIGYNSSGEKLEEDPAEFVVCLTEESTNFLVQQNRFISKRWREAVFNELFKISKSQIDEDTKIDHQEIIHKKPSRSLQEIELELPIKELISRKSTHSTLLNDRDVSKVRDDCVHLVPPSYEIFHNVDILHVGQTSQTTLKSKDGFVQTWPRRLRNQCTQYELEVPKEFLNIWRYEEKIIESKEEGADEIGEDETTGGIDNEVEAEVEKTEEEIMLEEKRRNEWNKLKDFLNDRVDDILDCISFNGATNLFTNDCAKLSTESEILGQKKLYEDLEEEATLIDLKTVGERCLLSASWHSELNDIIVCAYLDKQIEEDSLIVVWSLKKPAKPIMVLDCEEKIASLSFCNVDRYTDILVGGDLDGRIVMWEIHRGFLTQENDPVFIDDAVIEPPLRKAKIASSILNPDDTGNTIMSLQWLPTWCHISPDGSFHKSTSVTSIRAQFASSSLENTITFWSLPRSLSTPASHRSPLQLNFAPIYSLSIPQDQSTSITSFCLPISRTEDTSRLNLREDNRDDLARLQQVFVGTARGQICRCTWSGVKIEDEEVVDASEIEVCEVQECCAAHDGWVRCVVKSPHLDDVMLTVGGCVFALWKEDFTRAPIFSKRNEFQYGDGCWSIARPGLIVLARLDGCFEMWDLKRRSSEPVILQTVSREVRNNMILSVNYSNVANYEQKIHRPYDTVEIQVQGFHIVNLDFEILKFQFDSFLETRSLINFPFTAIIKVTPYIFPSPTTSSKKFLAVLDGASTLRIFKEADESRKDEDLERLEWFEEFAWRETKRKLEFHRWQDEYLREHPVALKRQQERRQAEADRKRQEAREKYLKEKEIEAREEAERELRQRRVSKSVIWRQNELKRAEKIILAKKGLVPHELEEKRMPLVIEHEKRRARLEQVKEELARADEILEECVMREVPELRHIKDKAKVETEEELKDSRKLLERTKEVCEMEYQRVKDRLIEKLKQKVDEPKFDWSRIKRAENARPALS